LEIIKVTEDNLSKAKGSKEKNKMKKQADEKKRIAKQKIGNTSKSQATLGGSSKIS